MRGQDIKKLRKKLDMSQREFAQKFYFTDQSHLSKIELEKRPVSDLRAAYMKLWMQKHGAGIE